MEITRGANFTAVNVNGVQHVYAASCPSVGSTYEEQLDSAISQLRGIFQSQGAEITYQNVFLRDLGMAEAMGRRMHQIYGWAIPATNYINQSPCEGMMVAVEAMGVGGNGVKVEYPSTRMTVAKYDGLTWVQTANSLATTRWATANPYNRTMFALAETEALLESVGARFDQVVRTWFYMGNIVADEGGNQRYKELNRARTVFFDQHGLTTFPASTGIGMAGDDVILSALAVMGGNVQCVPLENPRQVAAYDYAAHYSPQSPKFSRAMTVAHGGRATTYISGTASITASETQHLGDAERQTEETLDNIAALIGEENLAGHSLPGLGTNMDGLTVARAYVKHVEDYPAVRGVCENRLGCPVIYTMGDVCRDDLLVEIEAVAHSQQNATTEAWSPAIEVVRMA